MIVNRLLSKRPFATCAIALLALIGSVPAAFGAALSMPTNASIVGIGGTLFVDLSITGGAGFEAADIDVSFNSSVVAIDADVVPGALGTQADCQVTTNAATPGLVRMGVACVNVLGVPPIGSSGVLVRIPFRSVSLGSTNLVVSRCLINEDAISCDRSAVGTILVSAPVSTATATRTPTATPPPPPSTPTRTFTAVPPASTATSTRTRTATSPPAPPTLTSTRTRTSTIAPPVATSTITQTRTPTRTSPPPTSTRTRTATSPPATATRSPTRTSTSLVSGIGAAAVAVSVPANMLAGAQYPVSVTMQNTGTVAWNEASLFRLGAVNPYDNTTWGSGRILLGAGENIAPGQQKVFSFTVRAPAAAGTYNFQWRMVREGVSWFGDLTANAAITVTVPTTPPNAAYVTHSVPLTMVVGQQYTASVTMQNTGAVPWTPEGLFRLGSVTPENNRFWGSGRVNLNPGESIGPGQQKTFTWTVTAPPGSGLWNFQWRMLQEGVTWFGAQSQNTVVTVTNGGPPNATFVSQSVPTTMQAGQSYSVTVRMQNTGGIAWTAQGLIRLGAINPYGNAIWGMGRVGLGSTEVVGPGQQKAFTYTVRAPAAPGNYNFQWRMLQEGVTWFGDTSTNVVVNVTP